MRSGMNESADESDLACLRRPVCRQLTCRTGSALSGNIPNMTLQQFRIHMILSLGARYDLIFNNSRTVSWGS